MSGLRHVSFVVAELQIGADEVVLRVGDLIVARDQDAVDVDWELVAVTTDPAAVDHGAHRLEMITVEGRSLAGDAILVRSVGGTHVFRGAGPIDGFDPDELA